MNKNSSITIVGGGIVGCAIAYELIKNSYTNVTVIEKNKAIPGLNQSSTNEGTIHSGIYYPKDIMPLKAQLCVEGNALMYDFMKKYNLPHKMVGKLIIATNLQEEEYLDFFLQVGLENNIPGIKKITGKQAQQMEPNIKNVISALYIPTAGTASPQALIKKVKTLAEQNGVQFLLNAQLIAITPTQNNFLLSIKTANEVKQMKTDILINSAGLYSDEVAKMVNPQSPYEIDPARGEFFQFDKSIRQDIWMNKMHVYQPPYCYTTENGEMKKADIPATQLRARLKEGNVIITAGVHLSPAYDEIDENYILNNTVTISPLKTTGLGKEDYTSNLHQAKDYINKVHYFFPNLKEDDLIPDHTGIMAPLKGHRDYIIERDNNFPNCINLIGMESPSWTSCFAIAKYVRKNFIKSR